jgi:hypothetical protein
LADLFAALSISTNVPFAFFENPAFLSAIDQVTSIAATLERKNQVAFYHL